MMSAAPTLVDANRALARTPVAFEPALDPGRFITRAGVRVSPGELSMGPHSMRLAGADPRAHGVGKIRCPARLTISSATIPGTGGPTFPTSRGFTTTTCIAGST